MKRVLAGCLLASSLAAPSIARADDDRVHVHIKSEKHVQLESRPSQDDAWMVACDSPCDRDLPLGDEYRILYGTKATATRGDTFRLSASPGGSVNLTVDGGSTAQAVGGVVLGAGGVALAVVGLLGVAAVASVPSSSSDSNAKTAECSICGGGLRDLVALVSAVALIAGGGAILTGVLLVNDAGPSTSQKPVFAREPTWSSPRAAAPDKRAFVVPLSFSF